MHSETPQGQISPFERKRREALLRDIAKRVERFGAHEARAHADRARQFVPFAALKGYESMARSREFVPHRHREFTDEESRAFSEIMSSLSKGDAVRVSYCENGRQITIEERIVDKNEAFRMIRVGNARIPFEDIESIERIEHVES